MGGCTLTVLEAGPVSVQQITVLCGSDSRSEDQRMTQTPIDECVDEGTAALSHKIGRKHCAQISRVMSPRKKGETRDTVRQEWSGERWYRGLALTCFTRVRDTSHEHIG